MGGGERGHKRNSRCHPFFRAPPPPLVYGPKKDSPLCVKKFRSPSFFLRKTHIDHLLESL